MISTPHDDINALLDVLLTRMQSVLHDTLVGLYLYGSRVAGDFDHDLSDIDMLAVISKNVNKHEYTALKTMHEAIAREYTEWNDRIEVQYASLSALRTFKTKRSTIVTISPGEPIHFIRAGKDWLLNWYDLQEKGVALIGPHQKTIIPFISKGEYVNTVKESALYWRKRIQEYTPQSSRGRCAYIIFAMCRMLYGHRRGSQISKMRAAIWAAKKFPQWAPLIADTISWRKVQWEKEQKGVGSALRKINEFVDVTLHQILRK